MESQFSASLAASSLALSDEALADWLDQRDPVASYRQRFHMPKMKDVPGVDLDLVDPEDDAVYFAGHSLGLQTHSTREEVMKALNSWQRIGVESHFTAIEGVLRGLDCDQMLVPSMARLVGAQDSEVTIANGLTVNIHLLMAAFYQPTPDRHEVLIEDHAFPSDHYAVESQVKLRGYTEDSLVCLAPRPVEHCLRIDDVLATIEQHKDTLAMIWLPGVQYYTGQLFDIPRITQFAHRFGIVVGWDLAHSVGNVPLRLHGWEVDFAAWCGYKYLNGGPGTMAGLFVHERTKQRPALHGWWGHRQATRFNMDNVMELSEGASGFRVSNPPLLLCASLRGSLNIFDEITMDTLRQKSLTMTEYMERLIEHLFPPRGATDSSTDVTSDLYRDVTVITPKGHAERGAQLSLMVAPRIDLLKLVDKRMPSVIRLGAVPLYTRYRDVWRVIKALREAVDAVLDGDGKV